jgi:hypothetical protein
MSYTRIDLPDGRWVAVVPNDEQTAFGGTVWRKAEDGNWYADGVTAGHPVTAADAAAAGPQIAAVVDAENA